MRNHKSEVIIFREKNLKLEVKISPSEDTVWLSQKQMAELFKVSTDNIGLHIKNIYKEGELELISTTEESSEVQVEGSRKVRRMIQYYNLDVIISVGYRVKSNTGVLFRKWANKILKQYLYKGFAVDRERLKNSKENYKLFTSTVRMLAEMVHKKELTVEESKGLLEVIAKYSYALDTLDKYDHQALTISNITKDEKQVKLEYETAMEAIRLMPQFQESTLFGREKDNSFQGALNAIYQSALGDEVYPSIEEKAGNLLYFIVKDHAFYDGNKRIAASVFLWFLDIYGILNNQDGRRTIEDNALVAMVMMIALSKPEEKDIIVKIVINLINQNN